MYSFVEASVSSSIASKDIRTINLLKILVYFIMLFVFLLSDIVDFWFIDNIMRFVFGVITIILIPGEYIANSVLGTDHPLGFGLLSGLVSNLVFIQIQFIISLSFGVRFELDNWLSLCNILLIIFSWMKKPNSLQVLGINYWVKKTANMERIFFKILLIGILFRVGFAIIGLYSFSPDAGLYFDYARNINNGYFQSNVLNDPSVMERFNGTEEIVHQSISYLYSISYMFEPNIGNPILLLLITGLLLIVICYEIAKRFFDQSSAIAASFLVAIHPTLVYFSVIGYGPELFSLVFLLYSSLFLLTPTRLNNMSMMLFGIVLAFVESIWYVNYYIFIFIFPIILYNLRIESRRWFIAIVVSSISTIVARHFITNILVFILLWIFIFGIVFSVKNPPNLKIKGNLFAAFGGLLIGFLLLYLPSILANILLQAPVSVIGLDKLSINFFDILSIDYIYGSLFLIIWHVTPVLIMLIFAGIIIFRNNRHYTILLIATIISTLGIVIVLRNFESMRIEYLYTSARFLLLPISSSCILSGVLISSIVKHRKWVDFRNITTYKKPITEKVVVFLIMLSAFISFLPGYLVFEGNASYTYPVEQYSWIGTVPWVALNTQYDDIFLVDRAREFAWLTNKKAVVLGLSGIGLDLQNASNQLMEISSKFNTTFLVIDEYTIAHWKVFDYLINHPLMIGNAMLLDILKAIEQRSHNTTEALKSLKLVYQSQPNVFGSYSRIYQFDNSTYNLHESINLLDEGWNASNEGAITNSSGEIHLIIGSEAEYTNTWRPSGYDLNLHINGGYLLLNIEETGASVARVELFDTAGNLLAYAENAGNGLYYCPVGEVDVGDIRIVIEGDPGDSVIINSIAAWEVVT